MRTNALQPRSFSVCCYQAFFNFRPISLKFVFIWSPNEWLFDRIELLVKICSEPHRSPIWRQLLKRTNNQSVVNINMIIIMMKFFASHWSVAEFSSGLLIFLDLISRENLIVFNFFVFHPNSNFSTILVLFLAVLECVHVMEHHWWLL